MFDLTHVIAPGVHEMEEDAGVQVAAPGAHHDAASRREPHGGIERLTVVYCRQAGTVAQMRDHQATPGCRCRHGTGVESLTVGLSFTGKNLSLQAAEVSHVLRYRRF